MNIEKTVQQKAVELLEQAKIDAQIALGIETKNKKVNITYEGVEKEVLDEVAKKLSELIHSPGSFLPYYWVTKKYGNIVINFKSCEYKVESVFEPIK